MDKDKFNEMLEVLGVRIIALMENAENEGKDIDVEFYGCDKALIAKWEIIERGSKEWAKRN